MATPSGNISKFFVKLVSPVILKNRIVSTFLNVMFGYLEHYNTKIDNITNSDI